MSQTLRLVMYLPGDARECKAIDVIDPPSEFVARYGRVTDWHRAGWDQMISDLARAGFVGRRPAFDHKAVAEPAVWRRRDHPRDPHQGGA